MKLWNRSRSVLCVPRDDDSTIEDLFYCAPAWSKTCVFFRQQFLSLGLESVEANSEHHLAIVYNEKDIQSSRE